MIFPRKEDCNFKPAKTDWQKCQCCGELTMTGDFKTGPGQTPEFYCSACISDTTKFGSWRVVSPDLYCGAYMSTHGRSLRPLLRIHIALQKSLSRSGAYMVSAVAVHTCPRLAEVTGPIALFSHCSA